MKLPDWNSVTDEEFRLEARRFFDTHCPQQLRFLPRRMRWTECRGWYLKLSERGWIAPNWPNEFGGMGLSPAKQLIYFEELEALGIGRMPDHGITQVGPTLIRFGTQQQRARYLPQILAGAHVWCQGYSEPNAGSDLASLTTSAQPEGDEFVINGSKIWTSMALDATHIYMLARTRRAEKRQQGISFLLVDMASPGIQLRPIRNLNGHEEFCQVFFDGVRTPRDSLVGELDEGWAVAKGLLGFERLNIGNPRRAMQALRPLLEVVHKRGLDQDLAFMDRLTQLQLDMDDLNALYGKFTQQVKSGQPLGPDVSILKIWSTETFQRLAQLLLEAAGPYGALAGNLDIDGARVNVLAPFYNSRAGTIYGGSNEIQRNILARDVLRL